MVVKLFPFLIFLLICRKCESESLCKNIPANVTVPPVDYDTPLNGYFNLATSFVHVLSSSISKDQINALVTYFQGINNSQFVLNDFWTVFKPIFLAEIGYIILLALGIAFIVLMPLVGLMFCCCRCCDNCGGKRYQKDPSCCCCVFLLSMVFVCLIFLLTGVALYCVNNQEAFAIIKTVPDNTLDQAAYVTSFLNDTENQLICATEKQFNVVAAVVTEQLTLLPQNLANFIMNASGATALLDLEYNLGNASVNVPSVQNQWPEFVANVSSTETLVNTFVAGLLASDFSYLVNDTTKTTIPAEMNYYTTMTPEITSPSVAFISPFLATHDIPAMTVNVDQFAQLQGFYVNGTVQAVFGKLAYDNGQVQNVAQGFKTNIDKLLIQVNNAINTVNETTITYIQQGLYGTYSWLQYVSLVIVLPVLVVCILMLLGCCCGMYGNKGKAKPYERGCCSNCGGNSLMGAVVVLFMSSWILMLICMVLFSAGFATESFICRPMFEDSSLQFLSYVPNVTVIISDDSQWVFNLQSVLLNCEQDQAAYQALSLQSTVNLGPIFNAINQTAQDVAQLVRALDQEFSPTTMDPASIQSVLTVQANVVALNNQLTNWTTILSTQPVYTISFVSSALASLYSVANGTSVQSLITSGQAAQDALNSMLWYLNQLDNQGSSAAIGISQSVDDLTEISDSNFNNDTVTKFETYSYVESVSQQSQVALSTFVTTFNTSINIEIGKCRPLYDVYTNVGVIGCKQLLYPLQGWWLALGWCLLFFIPAICFNVRLSKYFRKMDIKYYQRDMSSFDGWNSARQQGQPTSSRAQNEEQYAQVGPRQNMKRKNKK